MHKEGNYYLESMKARQLLLWESAVYCRILRMYSDETDPPFTKQQLKDLFNYVHPLKGTLKEQLTFLHNFYTKEVKDADDKNYQ